MYLKIRSAYVEVDIKKAIDNFENTKKLIKQHSNNTKVCAVVKANSYGMGAVELSKHYIKSGVDMLAVAVISEAIELRRNFSDVPILILGYTPDCYFEDALNNNITLTIFTYEQAEALNKIAVVLNKKAKIHIKIETGMNRLGLLTTESNADLVKEISEMSNIVIEGMFTHFAMADEKDKSVTHMQVRAFMYFSNLLKDRGIDIPIKHVGNSATIIDLPEYYFDMVRAGIILSGFYPSQYVDKSRLSLKPCIALKAQISAIKKVTPHSGVSYGYTYKTKKEVLIGTIPLGYADGLSRSLSNNFYVLVNGVKCLQVGRICMDQFMVDISKVDNPKVGDVVTIYGYGDDDALTVEDVANIRGTISYEVESTLSIRLPRKYI